MKAALIVTGTGAHNQSVSHACSWTLVVGGQATGTAQQCIDCCRGLGAALGRAKLTSQLLLLLL